MNERIKEELHYIIENKQIKTVFQPIISLRDGSVLGHEALSRITCPSSIGTPDMLFDAAFQNRRLWDLELLCRTTALETAFKYMHPPYSKKLFLNVAPHVMHDQLFKKGFTKDFLAQYKVTPDNVIFEITEKNMILDKEGFRATISHYKNQSYQIAVDDAGSGYSGLNLISDIHPDFIKLDMNLIRGINADSLKYALVKGMVELSNISRIALIAEGIETYEELETLVNMGVQYGQGYFIQKPDETIREIGGDILLILKEMNLMKNLSAPNNLSNSYIKSLCTHTGVVFPSMKVAQVYDVFVQNQDCFGVCVIENQHPVGIMTREKLALKLSGHYGFTLHQNKPIRMLMDKQFLCVDCNTPISAVSALAMSRSNDRLYDFIVVTENGQYLGTVTIKDLLQKATEIEVSMAKHQNPLSGLPGNLIIEQKLQQCVCGSGQYSVAYFDIDNFKFYNDAYGFENGDLIIKLLAAILVETLRDAFVGHIGGDDFVAILYDWDSQALLQEVVSKFEEAVLGYYSETDLKNRFITAMGRHGQVEKTALMTLTCAVASNQTQSFRNVFDLTETLAERKKREKQRKLLSSCL